MPFQWVGVSSVCPWVNEIISRDGDGVYVICSAQLAARFRILGSTQELVYPRHGADPLMMRWDLGSGGYFVSCVLP